METKKGPSHVLGGLACDFVSAPLHVLTVARGVFSIVRQLEPDRLSRPRSLQAVSHYPCPCQARGLGEAPGSLEVEERHHLQTGLLWLTGHHGWATIEIAEMEGQLKEVRVMHSPVRPHAACLVGTSGRQACAHRPCEIHVYLRGQSS